MFQKVVTCFFVQVVILKNNQVASTLKVGYEPQSVAVSPDHTQVAVGGGDKVRDTTIVVFVTRSYALRYTDDKEVQLLS